jgi:hypothetical protein
VQDQGRDTDKKYYLDLLGFSLIYLDLVAFGSSKRRGGGVTVIFDWEEEPA